MSLRTRVMNAKIIIFFLGVFFLLVGCQHNLAPVADAGKKTTVFFDNIVYLDGSMSHDPDGDQLEFQWSFSIVPDGSSPYLDDANSAYASFVPDMPGAYILELRVFDGELYSGYDHVLINVISENSVIMPPPIGIPTPEPTPPIPPFVDAPMMPPQSARVDEEIIVQGTMATSSDTKISWSILDKPEDSIARFEILESDDVTFSANKTGYYLLQETIFQDGHEISKELFGMQVVESRVDAGPNKFVGLNSEVDLNFGYFDRLPPIDATIQWSIVSKPGLSEAEIVGADGHGAQFIPDIAGVYEVSVLVTMPDGGPQDEDSIIITVSEDFMGAIDHSMVEGTCVDCHNGLITTGKSATHIDSSGNCSACHSIFAWVPTAIVDHSEAIGSCAACHNGIIVIGKPSTHLTTTDLCEACHSTISFPQVIVVDHKEVIGSCISCHNSVFASGILPTHIYTTDNCDACHSITTFIPVIRVDHTQVVGTCESCHNNIMAIGKSASHVSTSSDCAECHQTSNWLSVNDTNIPVLMPDGLDISIENNAPTYQIGELITATAIFTNNSNVDIELYKFADNANPLQIEISGMNLDTLVLNNPNDLPFDSTGENISVLKAGESITREVAWDQIRFDSNGLTPKGNYTLEAFILALEPGTAKRQLIDIKSDIVIEHPADLIDINTAVLTALDDPAVKVWYENLTKNITCRLNDQVTLIKDYIITPIQTLVEVPKSDIQCHALLVDAKNPMWNVYFQNPNVTGNFSYHVNIDAVSGELVMSMSM